MEPPAPPADPLTVDSFLARIRIMEKAARLKARADWALRLINALRCRLFTELEALDSGEAPAPPVEARSFAAEADPAETVNPKEGSGRREREILKDYDRFGFEPRGSDKKLAEILKLPTAEIIAVICRELGLPADWPRVAEEAGARETADEDWRQPPREQGRDTSPNSPQTAAPS